MALVECIECGKQISDRAASCPGCGAPVKGMISVAVSPPLKQVEIKNKVRVYSSYDQVPWYRRSSVNTAFIFIGFGTKGLIPLALVTCILLFTGDIYYKTVDENGNLKVWSRANKFAAAILIFANLMLLGYYLYWLGQN